MVKPVRSSIAGLLVIVLLPRALRADGWQSCVDLSRWVQETNEVLLVPGGEKARGLAYLSEDLCQCASLGADVWGCAYDSFTANGYCILTEFGVFPIPHFPVGYIGAVLGWPYSYYSNLITYLADPDNPFCDGPSDPSGGNLKCCKYPGATYCHTAFNQTNAINCEGNPSTPGTPYGPCMKPPNGIGCLCTHIPECYPWPATDDQYARNHRRSRWFDRVADEFDRRLPPDADPASACTAEEIVALTTLRGCRGWFWLFEEAAPYGRLPPDAPVAPGDEATIAALNRDLRAIPAVRVMLAVPNGMARFDYIAARNWDAQSIAAYLGGVDPEAELLSWLSPCGLELLVASLPLRWPLLAVPYPGEDEPDRDPELPWRDGCVLGEEPEVTGLAVDVAGGAVTIEAAIDDPEAAFGPTGGGAVRVDWGDDQVTRSLADPAAPVVLSHAYGRPGQYPIALRYTNSAGLTDEISALAAVAGGAPAATPRLIESLVLPVSVAGSEPLVLDVWGEEAGGSWRYLGRSWSPAPGAAPIEPSPAPAFGSFGELPLVRLRLEPQTPDGGSGTSILLDRMVLGWFTSNGAPPPVEVAVEPQHVTTAAGGPVSMDPETGAALLADGGQYLLPLPCVTERCGADPLYGVSCGSCAGGEVCSAEGLCLQP